MRVCLLSIDCLLSFLLLLFPLAGRQGVRDGKVRDGSQGRLRMLLYRFRLLVCFLPLSVPVPTPVDSII